MNEKKQKLFCRLALLAIIIISVSVTVFLGFRRNIYHIDEVWSYSLGNSTDEKYWFDWVGNPDEVPLIPEEDFYNHWWDGNFFKDYITVRPGEEFRYDIAYDYQSTDLSPPLYYAMIHTVCSLFPGQFSKWFGLVPNIIFMVFSIPLFYLICKRFFRNNIHVLITVAFWAFSRAAISDVVYIRMYMLATLEMLLSFLLHLKFFENKDKNRYYLLPFIFIVNVLGFMSQNYIYISTFFMAAVICLYLLKRKNIRKFIVFSATELLSVVTAFIIFPAAPKQMFMSEHTNNIKSDLFYDSFESIDEIITVLVKNFTGISEPVSEKITFVIGIIIRISIAICILFYILYVMNKKQKIKFDEKTQEIFTKLENNPIILACKKLSVKKLLSNEKNDKYVFLVITFAVADYIMALTTPEFIVFRDRYHFMMLPLFYLIAAKLIIKLITCIGSQKNWKKKTVIAVQSLLIVSAILSNFGSKNAFLFYAKGQPYLEDLIHGEVCIAFHPEQWKYLIHGDAPIFQNAEKVLYSTRWNDEVKDMINDIETCCLFLSPDVTATMPDMLSGLEDKHNIEHIGIYNFNEYFYDIYRLTSK